VPAIIAHGGAGRYSPGEEHERGLKDAVAAGWEVLDSGGSALDAIEAAIVVLEDFPVFQAGFGSAMNIKGEIQTDASIMLGDLSCGAVAALTAAANPIKAARLVMEKTDHVLIVGDGADHLAQSYGLESRDLRSDARKEMYDRMLAKLRAGEEVAWYLPRLREVAADMSMGTVGAVAVDSEGRIASGTSTGGPMLKLPGRVGDAAVIGAGTYANENGGVSATGVGEPIIKHALAKKAVDLIADQGAREGIETLMEYARIKKVRFGIVAVEENEAIALGYTTEAMSWVSMKDGELKTFLSTGIGVRKDDGDDGTAKDDSSGKVLET
jgi:beta-aspartyl-peptidase (threonine type)